MQSSEIKDLMDRVGARQLLEFVNAIRNASLGEVACWYENCVCAYDDGVANDIRALKTKEGE